MYDITYMRNLKKENQQVNIKSRNRLRYKLVVTMGEGREEGQVRDRGLRSTSYDA